MASAQTPAWPTKPVKIITGWTPGGNADAVSRLLADQYAKRVPQTVIVDNRPGAAGTIGAGAVARSEPDGNTLLVATMVEVTVVPPASVQSMGYDPDKELTPVTMIGRWPLVLVANPSFPPNTMAELVAYAKANKGKVDYGSLGNASINHLTGELLNISAGIDAVHVPYKGGAPMMTDLMGGQIQYAFDSVGATLPLIKSGKVKAIAITDTQRAPALPTVPTTAEAGFPRLPRAFGWVFSCRPRRRRTWSTRCTPRPFRCSTTPTCARRSPTARSIPSATPRRSSRARSRSRRRRSAYRSAHRDQTRMSGAEE